MRILCEACGGRLRDRPLAVDQVLDECGECGHLARDLQRAPAAHRELAYGGEPSLDRWRLSLTYRLMRRHLSSAQVDSVFEIGFGDGSMLRRFLDDGVQIAGADPDQLRSRIDPVVRERGHLHLGTVETAPHDTPVDLVYGIHVLEHVEDPARTLEVSRRLLRPGGVLQCFTPAGDSDGLRLYRDAWWMLEDPTHVRFFTAESLRRMAADAGFRDIRVRRPLLDSMTTDVASIVRRVRPRPRPGGVLGRPPVLYAGLASAPVAVAARAARPRMRPTLQLVARV